MPSGNISGRFREPGRDKQESRSHVSGMYGRVWEHSEWRVKFILAGCLCSRYFISLTSLISQNALDVIIVSIFPDGEIKVSAMLTGLSKIT